MKGYSDADRISAKRKAIEANANASETRLKLIEKVYRIDVASDSKRKQRLLGLHSPQAVRYILLFYVLK